MTGIGLVLISVLIFYFALSQPKVTENSVVTSETETVTAGAYDESDEQSTAPQGSETQGVTAAQTEYAASDTSASQGSVNGKINLNTCTAAELTSISGIGEKRADAIIQYREYLGGYTSVEQIKNIKGIGDKLYEKIAPYLTV